MVEREQIDLLWGVLIISLIELGKDGVGHVSALLR